MSRAVRFDEYGGIDVLQVVDVPDPVPGPGEALVRVKATSINPGEAKIREGMLDAIYPATFPSGEGSDLAGVVEAVGDGVTGVAVGDEVIGFTDTRSAHAESAVTSVEDLTPKPSAVSWEAAGSLYVAGCTAWAAVRAVGLGSGDTVVVAGAAGGVGVFAVQLARAAGATVIGIAGESKHDWLRAHGAEPVTYGDGVEDRLRAAAPGGIEAFLDLVGGGYVEIALSLGVAADRIDTIADFEAPAKHGVKADGNAAGGSASTLAELAGDIVSGALVVPIAATYRLEQVREAYAELERGHTLGKIVLLP
jgi:NADPH:quinone reductase-like Zn-dependent oxidoreductase